MRVTVLDTDAALFALAPEWDALCGRVPAATPFGSPGWLLPWWQAFGTGRPIVAALWASERLAGLLPLYVLEEGGGRKLLPIGAGTSDYLDALIEPGLNVDSLLHPALAHAAAAGVTVCDMIDVPTDGVLRDATAPPGWHAQWHEGETCPVLALPPTVAALAHALPSRTLRKLRMNRNRATRAGGWEIVLATEATLDADLEDLIRLHQARWTAQGEPGVLADARVLTHLRQSACSLLAAGCLRLCTLRLDGAVAAAIWATLGPGRILFYLSGFDAARAFESPGTLLLGDMIEQAIGEGRREAHFLRGREAYKYAWGGVDRANATLSLRR